MDSLSNYIRLIAKKVGRAITFLGTGPANPIIDRSGKSNRKNTSTLIAYKGKNYRIDVPPDLDTKVTFDYLLITHLHSDAWDGFKKVSDRKFVFGIPDCLEKKIKEEGPWKKKTLKTDRRNELGDLTVTPFDVVHDIVYKMRTIGYRITFKDGFTIVYASDLLKIPEKSEQYFENVDLLIVGGTGWNADLSTHVGIWPFLDLIKQKKWNIKKIYFNQIGRPVPDYEDAQKQLLLKYGRKPLLAYDGLQINF
jgi:Metal-dependent hydrolases of the beta-lactamase superfamily I